MRLSPAQNSMYKANLEQNKVEDAKGFIFNIQRYSIHDGPGIRTTVFMKGCPLKCIWCANPEGQAFRPEIFFNPDKCTGCGRCVQECPQEAIEILGQKSHTDRQVCIGCGRCAAVCPNEARSLMGKQISAREVLEEIRKDAIFYERSGGGVTLSGGEPLVQPEFATAILRLCKGAYIHTALETCGQAQWEAFEEVLKSVDLLLYDFKHMEPAKHEEYTSVSNHLILDNVRRACHKLSIPIWARVPVIPGYNDSMDNIEATARFIAEELGNCVKRVNLLPYHRLGETKFERLEVDYKVSSSPPDQEHLQELQEVVERFGLSTYIGG
jgi:pyruvate formate lyase activating enzyme